MDFTEKKVSSECRFSGRVFTARVDTVTLPDGATAGREVVEHPGGVCVLAVTSEREVLMVRQYRYPCREHLWELPAGKLEPGEDPMECGRRELLEETGATSEIFLPMGHIFASPGYSSEKLYLFYADGLSFGEQQLDQGEFLELRRIPLARALDMAAGGELCDGKTLAALLRFTLLDARR